MFNDTSSLTAHLATRRSGKPRDMIAPGPDKQTLGAILQLAMRTPDHGKLFPWRFVIIDDRKALADLLGRAFVAENPNARPGQIDAAAAMAYEAPTLVVLLYSPQPSAKVPHWEQKLSVGAVGMNLLHAAHAHGFVGSWITGWPTFDKIVRNELGKDKEKVAGFFYLGTADKDLEERPRPDPKDIIRHWPG